MVAVGNTKLSLEQSGGDIAEAQESTEGNELVSKKDMDSKKTSDSTSESTASQEEESNIAATVDYWKRKYNRLDALLSKRELSKAGREAVKVSERLYPVAVDILKDVYIPPRYHDPSLPAPKRISRTAVTQSHVAQDDFGDLEYQEEDFTEAFEGVEIEDEHLVGPEDESGSEESTTGDPEDSDTQGAAESDDDGDDGGDSDEPYRPKRKGEGEGKSTEKGKGKSIAKGKGNAVSSVSSEGNSSDDAELGEYSFMVISRYSAFILTFFQGRCRSFT